MEQSCASRSNRIGKLIDLLNQHQCAIEALGLLGIAGARQSVINTTTTYDIRQSALNFRETAGAAQFEVLSFAFGESALHLGESHSGDLSRRQLTFAVFVPFLNRNRQQHLDQTQTHPDLMISPGDALHEVRSVESWSKLLGQNQRPLHLYSLHKVAHALPDGVLRTPFGRNRRALASQIRLEIGSITSWRRSAPLCPL